MNHSAFGIIALLVTACGSEPAPNTPASAPDPAPAESAAPSPGSPSSPTGEMPPAMGKRAPCDTDQSCNDDPAVSALWGKCNAGTGTCECQSGFVLNPKGRCQPH